MSNYTEECLKNYKKLRQTFEVQIDFEIYPNQILIYYYYNNREYFNLSRTIRNLNRYLQKCNMNLHFFFNRSKHLTRLEKR